jgi:hypothetical protein
MARRKPKSRRKQSQKRRTPVKSDSRQSAPESTTSSSPQSQVSMAEEELAETYGYVRRDLMRIAILAVILFAIIIVSPLFLM